MVCLPWFKSVTFGYVAPPYQYCCFSVEIEYKYASISWLPISFLKKDNPLDIAKYAVDKQVADGPDFNWWARSVENIKEAGI